jgi:hypothetical protein
LKIKNTAIDKDAKIGNIPVYRAIMIEKLKIKDVNI